MSWDVLNYPKLKAQTGYSERDFYPTPEYLINAIVDNEKISKHLLSGSTLDLGCGNGTWGHWLRTKTLRLDGIDIHKVDNPMWVSPYGMQDNSGFKDVAEVYDNLYIGDFLKFNFPSKYNIIGFNPPFNLMSDAKTKAPFLDKVKSLLHPFGKFITIMPITYLSGKWRYDNLYRLGYLEMVLPFTQRIDYTGAGNPRKMEALYVFSFDRINTNKKPVIEFLDTSNKG